MVILCILFGKIYRVRLIVHSTNISCDVVISFDKIRRNLVWLTFTSKLESREMRSLPSARYLSRDWTYFQLIRTSEIPPIIRIINRMVNRVE